MKRKVFLVVLAVLALVLLGGAIAPFLNADRYRGRLEDSLSAALGRQVTMGEIRLSLFSGPGFTAANVVIADDPALSGEPLAYVGDLRATPRIWTLWTNHLEFSSLTLGDAHLNLTRAGEGTSASRWNFEPLLSPRLLRAFPSIHMRGGRINFKIGQVKSPFYLLDADLDVSPRAMDGSDWSLRFAGAPARTDRPARGFGNIEASGRWVQSARGAGHLELDLRLDQSEMNDVIALVHGNDVGLHGEISGRVLLSGPLEALAIRGQIKAEALHGRDQGPSGGAWPFDVFGSIDIPAQHLELMLTPPGTDPAVSAKFVADRYLSTPDWRLDLHAKAFPLDPLAGLLRSFGVAEPASLRVKGAVDGDAHFASAAGWEGKVTVRDAALELQSSAVAQCAEIPVVIADGLARIGPAAVVSEKEPVAEMSGIVAIAAGAYRMDFVSKGETLIPLLARLPGLGVPLLGQMRKGSWAGTIVYDQPAQGDGAWSGKGVVSGAVVELPALAEPLHVDGASAVMTAGAIALDHLRMHAGAVAATGEYGFEPGAARPHHLRMALGKVDAAVVETLLAPTLRREHNLIEKALRLGRNPLPDWLAGLHADGTIAADAMALGDLDLTRFRTRVIWDGAQVGLPDLQARAGKAVLTGDAAIDLSEDAARYSGTARLAGIAWKGGRVDATGKFASAGSGKQTLLNLKADGKVELRGGELGAMNVERAAGDFVLSWGLSGPVLGFANLEVTGDGESWTGVGASGKGGMLVFDLDGEGRKMRVEGPLSGGEWVAK